MIQDATIDEEDGDELLTRLPELSASHRRNLLQVLSDDDAAERGVHLESMLDEGAVCGPEEYSGGSC